jgi:hypothetical protein
MAAHEYRFVTHWRVEGTAEEVYGLIDDPSDFVRWWPSVWLRVEVINEGPDGQVVRLLSKGWLPYLLNWTSRVTDCDRLHHIFLRASGDFEGEGRWSFRPDGSFVDIEYIWTIEANKPLLRHLSFLLKPLFAANHQWAMARGEESLKLELARRHAASDEERARIPAPPRATFMNDRRRQSLGLT